MRILIIEDDRKIASFLKKGFKEVGYAADVAEDGENGLTMVRQGIYDAIVADLMLPKLDGLGMIERVRAEGIETPVIILSAKRSVDDRIRGLQAGGDDYMVKPFSFSELLVRIQTLLRRSQRTPQATVLEAADLRLNLTNRAVERGNEPIELQPREFALLEYFMRNPGRVVTKTAILEHVYDYSFDPQTNVVDVLVCRLRNRIDKQFDRKLIHTVRGVGYVLKTD
ncbi:winged helix-turn-helix domain-containing protein [Pontiella sulfatireligans]|uniref:Transcriptional activator protein CzcR n=1 Tax=Pontiella sulfatireligans TaxID=2750658 RepID=A0A6C2UJ29_9BACT|nr:response regulator transcription factor [Pontiella sulfatireligans]VGO20220.1 Transcriptional activator protein CzcR [Pontiella sulfatireligans]